MDSGDSPVEQGKGFRKEGQGQGVLQGGPGRSDCEDGKIRFVLNESNVMGSGFREKMNSLLANAEGKEGTPRRWRS